MRAGDRVGTRWRAFARECAAVQARVLLGLLYFTILLPFALLLRMTSNPFRTSGWEAHERSSEPEPEAARRQF